MDDLFEFLGSMYNGWRDGQLGVTLLLFPEAFLLRQLPPRNGRYRHSNEIMTARYILPSYSRSCVVQLSHAL